jgi:hypothetical protein
MKSKTTREFRKAFARLPRRIQTEARDAFKVFLEDPQHPSLRFKRVHSTRPIFSVRITIDYRALGVRDEDTMVWFWIGGHEDYDKLLSK